MSLLQRIFNIFKGLLVDESIHLEVSLLRKISIGSIYVDQQREMENWKKGLCDKSVHKIFATI